MMTTVILPIIHADHITVQGTVSGTWSADTVFVAGDLLVADGQHLLIQPGVKVIFNGTFHFFIEGSIEAVGNETDSIFFTVADTTGFGTDTIAAGGWRGIRFDGNRVSNDTSLFLYCHFAFGKMVSDDPATGNGGAISVRGFNKVRIGRSLFRHNFATFNGGAVSLDSANIMIHDCAFRHNRCGLSLPPWGYGGAVSSDNSSPGIRGNIFENNASTGIGGALAVRYIDCDIYSNVITWNYSALGGGIGILHMPEVSRRINNNLIADNTALYFGGGVANINASPIYINNTIAFNTATYGGGFYCKDSVSPDFYNTIIWGNTAAVGDQGYLFEVYSQADFFHCDVEGGPELFGGSGGGEAFFGAYEACIEEDPLFAFQGLHPYSLASGSPCIDAGATDTTGFMLPAFDLEGNPRVSGGRIDIGAYEFMVTGVGAWGHGGVEAWGHGGVVVWPNPTTGKFRVQSSEFRVQSSEFRVQSSEFRVQSSKFKVELHSLELIDIYGNILETSNPVTLEPWNPGTLELNISHLPAGIYFLRVWDGNSFQSVKLIKVSHR